MKKLNADFKVFPVLTTQRLILRAIEPADAADLFKIFSNPAVTGYYDIKTMKKIESARALIRYWLKRITTGKALRWAITLKENHNLIGTCGFSEIDKANYLAEIGYDLNQANWGQGLMTEALEPVLRFGFEYIGLNRVETWISQDNVGSIRVVEKTGLKIEGHLLQKRYWNKQFQNVELFGLLKSDWEQKNGPDTETHIKTPPGL